MTIKKGIAKRNKLWYCKRRKVWRGTGNEAIRDVYVARYRYILPSLISFSTTLPICYKTDRQLQPGQWFGSQPSMVITLVNNVLIRAF